MSWLGFWLLAVAWGSTGQTAEAPLSTSQEPTEVDEVVVYGRALEDAARAFVDAAGDRPPRGTLPGRWTKSLCVRVAGLRPPHGQQMVDGISRRAAEVGLGIGEPGCAANVLVVGTDDGKRTAKELVRADRRRFRYPVDHSSQDLRAMGRFMSSDAPVRWWHLTLPRSVDDGVVAGRSSAAAAGATMQGFGTGIAGSTVPFTRVSRPSLIRSPLRYDLETVTVVIDFSKTERAAMSALTDYVAMVVLTQVDPDAAFGPDTVLSLFDDPASFDAMTEWDEDYLKAAYEVGYDRLTVAAHEGSIARRLAARRHRSLGEDQTR
ncbi:hypothetical protein [Brevundimonas sp. PAMC22021]|uniref:hypothetical protein n=1 Tax=Brevundimonas sp. PAMC22021 TaxID=2861285 RepID=UPI001C62FB81|nr:hypothetical protein [Brevundimonas sp. PAMC22021]QYF86203.1 hypothetical protein KY493_10155 [Brevundimonas sp. PAMC22021]